MTQAPSSTTLHRSPQHFEVLDGLRGVAAIAVVIFHFMEIAIPDYKDNFIAHAYLAVDFFFCLSGFVIAYAYDGRLPQIGALSFFKLRLIRLHPLVVVTSILGLVVFMLDPYSDLWVKYADKMWLMFIASCFMVPFPAVQERYFNLFHLNPPTWSLFWEYVANIFYAWVLVKLSKKWLWVLTVIATGALFYEAQLSGNLSIGWGGDNIHGGGIRVAFSFLAGVLVYRSGWIIKSRLGFAGLGLLLMAVFLIPFRESYNKIMDPVVIVLVLPLLVALGAGAMAGSRALGICRFWGKISYPLYMVHYPFIWVFFSYVQMAKPTLSQMVWITAIGTLLLIALAYVVFVFVDVPLRRFLSGRFVKARLAEKPVTVEQRIP